MKKIDFISGTTKISLFKEGANKTILGGTLFFIYSIILVLLAIVYLFNYFSHDKYEYNYTSIKKSYNDNNFLEKEEQKSMLYTEMEYIFLLYKGYYPQGLNDFLIIDNQCMSQKMNKENDNIFLNSQILSNSDECIIRSGQSLFKKTSDLSVSLLYRCNQTDCSIRDNDKTFNSYYLLMGYKGFQITHQNSEKPIQPLPDGDYMPQTFSIFNYTNIVHLNWELIEYEEKISIFQKIYNDIIGNNYTYYGGSYNSKDIYVDDGYFGEYPDNIWKIKDSYGNHFKLLLILESFPIDKEYEKYSRTKISILDALSNVVALSSSALNLMSLAYAFLYSDNYDNYKLIEKLLTKRMGISINKNELPKKNIEDEGEEAEIELKTDLIESENEKSDMNINGSGEGEEESEKEKKILRKNYKENLDLPRLKFFDFLIHKFYFKCCKSSRKQNLIGSCNDIIAKYVTKENLLYNQIKLEHLWKDYKWNNPLNERNQKDNLILDLKEK